MLTYGYGFSLKKILTTGSTSLGPLTTGSACCSYGRSGSNVFGFDCLTIPGACGVQDDTLVGLGIWWKFGLSVNLRGCSVKSTVNFG